MATNNDIEVSAPVKQLYEQIAARAHAAKDQSDAVMQGVFDRLENSAELIVDIILQALQDPDNAEQIKSEFVNELLAGIIEELDEADNG